jgi:hypothetical protein
MHEGVYIIYMNGCSAEVLKVRLDKILLGFFQQFQSPLDLQSKIRQKTNSTN